MPGQHYGIDYVDAQGNKQTIPADFRAFTYDNARRLWGDSLFANTVIGSA